MASIIRPTQLMSILDAELPNHDKTYTVIPHGRVIEEAKYMLAEHGFEIKKEVYKSTLRAQVATAKYDLVTGHDDEIGMMFAWVNSYDKTTTFKCAVGGNVFVCTNGMIHGDMNKFNRKHTGDALTEVIHAIDFQISNAHRQYDRLLEAKRALKEVTLPKKRAAELVGYLYADENILNTLQVSIIKKEMKKPSFDYNANEESAWPFYNHITHALKESHPRNWMDDHINMHSIVMKELALN